jgi:DNA polymerase III delta prime subunit
MIEKGVTDEQISSVPLEFRKTDQKALFRLPKDADEFHSIYQKNKPSVNDPLELFQKKQKKQDNAFRQLLEVCSSLIEKQGKVTQPAVVTRRLCPLFDNPRYEVRSIDRNDAQPGRPLFVVADLALEDEVRVGDVVVLSGEDSRIIDVDNDLPRSGEVGTIIGIHPDQDFPYELELESDGYINHRLDAIKWERLEKSLEIGDRVKVMCGVIHHLAPQKSYSQFVKNPRVDLDRSDLHGAVPCQALDNILTQVDRYFNPEKYPARTTRFGEKTALLFYGPPGVGKTHCVSVAWSILKRKYNNGSDGKIVFLGVEGSAIDGALVGSGPKALREIRSLAQKAVEQRKLPITFINEAGSLLRSREVQSMQLDGGSSLATHEQFLAMLSGPEEIPGILIVDLNMERQLDEATRQRFSCIAFPHVDQVTLVDKMFKSVFEKEKDLFEGPWKDFRRALLKSLETAIGKVMVGAETVPVGVGHLSSGRMYEQVIIECIRLVDLCIFKSRKQDIEPLFSRITSTLLYYALTKRAWSLFKCWDTSQARARLVHEIARREKSTSINNPLAYGWHEIKMPEEYDCRGILDELANEMFEESEKVA